MTLLQRTSQTWKIYLFIGLFVSGALATLLQGLLYELLGSELVMQVAFGGVVLIIGSFVWAGQTVICPQCRLKLFYHAFRHQAFMRWFAWLLLLEQCPRCGFGQMPRAAGSRRKTKGLKRP